MAVCTNKPNNLANKICENLDIAKYFDFILGAQLNKPKKPDPYLLRACVKNLKCNLDEVRYVGDSTVDFDTAISASVNFYLFTAGYLNKPYPDLKVCNQFDNWKYININ